MVRQSIMVCCVSRRGRVSSCGGIRIRRALPVQMGFSVRRLLTGSFACITSNQRLVEIQQVRKIRKWMTDLASSLLNLHFISSSVTCELS